MGFLGIGKEWVENGDGNEDSYVRFVQVFSEKKATALKRTALVVCPVHIILLIFQARRRKWLIGKGYVPVGFLPVFCAREGLEKKEIREDEGFYLYGLQF